MNFNEQHVLSVSSVAAAVKLKEVDALRDLIKKGRNVNLTDNRGWTALHEAAALDHTDCLRILLKAGARTDACTHRGETALFVACERNNLASVKILLKWDSNVINISNNESVTPLHVCSTKHCLLIAKLLIDNKAMINAEDNSGITPLHEAILSKDTEICKLLIESGVNLNSRDYNGNLAFHFACMIGNIELTQLLLNCYSEKFDTIINDVNSDGFTPLMLAVQCVSLDTAEELLLRGADPNIVNKDKTLALHLAVHSGNLDMLRCIYLATCKDVINKYCSMADNELQSYSNDDPIKSLICLAIDAENYDCLDFLLRCGLSYDVLNCPIIVPQGQIQRFNDMRRYVSLIEEEHTYGRSNRVVLHPISFLLHEKFHDLKENTSKFLKNMLQNGYMFDGFNYNTDLIMLHPLEVAIFHISSCSKKLKGTIVECFHLMIEHGISPDYVSPFNSDSSSVPMLFIYACRLGLVEIIPHLLKYSNLVEVDDLLKWLINYIFTHKSSVVTIANVLYETYKFLKSYTALPDLSEFKKPEYENRLRDFGFWFSSDTESVPSLKIICRSAIRRTIRESCKTCPHQFNLRLKGLELPTSVLSFLNFQDTWDYEYDKT